MTYKPRFFMKHSIIFFFILSYAFMIVGVLLKLFTPIPQIIYWIITAWSPTISALILSGIIGGIKGIGNLLKGFLKWKISFKWYLAAFILMIGPLIFTGIYILLGGSTPGPPVELTISLVLFNLLFTLLSGPLSEEAGWRGFALPRLESRYSALVASLILGVVWACWHLPLYLVESRIPFYIFFALVLVITILMTWGYNNTNGSLLITVIFHFSFNFNGAFITGLLGLLPTMIFYIGGGVMIGVYLILVIIYFGPRNLSRKDESQLPFKRVMDSM
jgi:membrane protease YdiL (CAAX protease family)